ncbi:MAG: FeoA domain-containing protein [Desulfohalobiaceae bacterium]
MTPCPLNHFPSGSKVAVASLSGGKGARSRLYALGFTPGTEVLITSCGAGPVRIKVRGSDLSLGQGLAEKVFVTPVE